jgi:hypothetical protein
VPRIPTATIVGSPFTNLSRSEQRLGKKYWALISFEIQRSLFKRNMFWTMNIQTINQTLNATKVEILSAETNESVETGQVKTLSIQSHNQLSNLSNLRHFTFALEFPQSSKF